MKRPSRVIGIGIGIGMAAALALAGCSAPGESGVASSTVVGPGSGSAPGAEVAAKNQQPPGPVEAATAPTASAGSAVDRAAIAVQGVGKVTGTPDVMTIVLGVETRAALAKAALEQNNTLAAQVIAVLKDSGVDPADLQTSRLSVSPTYGDKNDITGYQVTNSVTAVLRDVAGAGAVIDAVGQQAGNAARVQQLSFSIDDDSALRSAARADAVKQAQVQAKQLADAAGVQLGAVRSITESNASLPTPLYAAAESSTAAAAVPVEPGIQELRVVVQVVYDIAG